MRTVTEVIKCPYCEGEIAVEIAQPSESIQFSLAHLVLGLVVTFSLYGIYCLL